MAIRNKYYPSTVSRYLPPGETAYTDVVYQKGKLVLDSELILQQDIKALNAMRQLARTTPSGFIRGQSRGDSYDDFSYDDPWSFPGPVLNPDFVPDSFHMKKVQALVAGMMLDIEYAETDVDGDNRIILDPATLYDGSPPTIKRSDFVFLEVWLALVSESPNAKGTLKVSELTAPVVGDTVTVNGVVFTGVLVPPLPTQFRIFPSSPVQTALSLATQINAFPVPAVTAVANANIVQITATAPGFAGNAIGIASSNGVAITPSGPLLTGGVDTPNKPTQDSVYRHGNTQSSPAVALVDNIEDPDVGVETTKRVQVQYRIRHTGTAEGVNFKLQADGFSNVAVLAQGAMGAPVGGYPFVPADQKSVVLGSDATAYDAIDNGLFIAGSGSEADAAALDTLDGFVYAIPIAFVFRRNNAYDGGAGAGWEPLDNTNGGLTHDHADGFVNINVYAPLATGESDRVDGYFSDALVDTDVMDLRRHVKLTGQDLAAELQYQMQALQDGTFRTWAIDTASKQELGAGSGDVSTQNLVCNEIGRTAVSGGVPPLSGDTTRGETIRDFDLIARRFGDQPVVERVVFVINPTDTPGANPGKYSERAGYAGAFFGWAEEDILHIDLADLNVSTLADFFLPSATALQLYDGVVPPGTLITDVLSVFHDDGNYGAAVDQTLKATQIIGLGSSHLTVQLDVNATQVNGGTPIALADMVGTLANGDVGSRRPVFLELEITYPLGAGTTDTPDHPVTGDPVPFPFGAMVENDLPAGPVQRPGDMENPLPPSFRPGIREVMTEYVSNDATGGVGHPGVPIGGIGVLQVVSRDTLSLIFPRRFFGSPVQSVTVTDAVDTITRVTDDPNTHFGASTRLVNLVNLGIAPAIPLSGAGQTLCNIVFFGQDPLPNYGAVGYQQSIYYRTNAPQTAGTKEGVVGAPGFTNFPYTGAAGTMPTPLLVEPLYVSQNVWTGQVGMGSVELPYPYFAPLDQLPVNDGRTFIPPSPPPTWFPGEFYFAATANISIDAFDAQVGTLALHTLVPAEGSIQWTIGGVSTDEEPFKDIELRAMYPIINRDGHRPTAMAQGMSNVVRHKVFVPALCRSLQDSVLFRKDEILLVVMTRWARLDANNVVSFDDNSEATTGVGVFRTKNLLLTVGNQE
jgi:hypothetical protein